MEVLGQIVKAVAAPATVMLRFAVAVRMGLLASLTLAVKFDVVAPVGVPAMAPVFEFSVRPAGSEPAERDQA
jgi:hypothetical protein